MTDRSPYCERSFMRWALRTHKKMSVERGIFVLLCLCFRPCSHCIACYAHTRVYVCLHILRGCLCVCVCVCVCVRVRVRVHMPPSNTCPPPGNKAASRQPRDAGKCSERKATLNSDAQCNHTPPNLYLCYLCGNSCTMSTHIGPILLAAEPLMFVQVYAYPHTHTHTQTHMHKHTCTAAKVSPV
jgi:hypothetical protein